MISFSEGLTNTLAVSWNAVAETLVYTLFHFLWQGTIAGMLLWILLRCLPDSVSNGTVMRSRAAARYFVSCLILFSLPLMVVSTYIFRNRSRDNVEQLSSIVQQ